MSHLVEEYAKSCGVKIGEPFLYPLFYPINFDKYITIHHATCPATTYSYWDETIEILKPFLDKRNIKIIQLLHNEEQKITPADKHIICSNKNASFILKNSLCHIGVDSVFLNIAGQHKIPLLGIYSHTNPNNTRPWAYDKKKTVLISSVQKGWKPSYDPNESNKTINSLTPEKIASQILKLLGIDRKIKFKTLLIGERYKESCLDLIPSSPIRLRHDKINVRMDVLHNEEGLKAAILDNFVEVTVSRPISREILDSRKISIINYISETFDKEFVEKVKSLGIHLNLLCVSEKSLADQRFKFFEHDVAFYDLQKIMQENAKRFQDIASKKIKTKSNKVIVYEGKEYYSYLDAIQSKELFLLDLDWLYLYTVE